MKRYASIALLILGTLSLSAANLVKNGVFDNKQHWGVDGDKALLTIVPGSGVGGSSALELRCDSGEKAIYTGAYQNLPLVAGTDYQVKFMVKCSKLPEKALSIRVLSTIQDAQGQKKTAWVYKPPRSGIADLYLGGGDHDWKQVEFIIPGESIPKATANLFFIQLRTNAPGKAWIDNVEVTPVEKKPVVPEKFPNLVRNGEFNTLRHWQFDGRKDLGKILPNGGYQGTSGVELGSAADAAKNSQVTVYQNVPLAKGKAHRITFMLKCQDVPKDSFAVRFLISKRDAQGKAKIAGWINKIPHSGIVDLYKGGGTHDWKKVDFVIDGECVEDNVANLLFLQRQNVNQGTVWIDNVEVREEPLPPPPAEVLSQNLWTGDTSFETTADQFTFPRDDAHAFHGRYSLKMAPKTGAAFKLFTVQRPGSYYSIAFYARSDKPCRIRALSTNDEWKWSGHGTFNVGPEWKRYVFKVEPTVIPCSVNLSIYILSQEEPGGAVWVDAIGLYRGMAATNYKPAEDYWVAYDMLSKMGIIHTESTAFSSYPAVLSCRNNTPVDRPVKLVGILEDASTKKQITLGSYDLTLKANSTLTFPKDAPQVEAIKNLTNIRLQRGYYVLRSQLLDANGKILAKHSQPISVIPPPLPVRKDSLFGIHFSDGVKGRNLGAAWTRTFENWQPDWMDKERKNYNIPVEPRTRVVTQTGMRQSMCINLHSVRGPNNAKGTVEEMQRFAAALVESYQGKLDYVEIENEPDLCWMDRPEEFGHAVNAAVSAIKKVNPNIKIVSGCVSGVDFNRNFTYLEQFLKVAGKNVDVLSVHPYTWNHYVDASGADIGPEHALTFQRAKILQEIIKRNGGNQEIWYGEVGWAPDVHEDYVSVVNRRNASYVPRLMALSMSAGVKKVFYFLLDYCLERERYNYGLWLCGRPLPGTVAYATCAANLEGATPLEPVANNDYHIFPYRHRDGRMMAALWTSNRVTTKLFIPMAPGEIDEVQDMFGRRHEKIDTDGKGHVVFTIDGEITYLMAKPGISEKEFVKRLTNSICQLPAVKFSWQAESNNTAVLTLENIRTQKLDGKLLLSGVPMVHDSQSITLNPGESRSYRVRSTQSINNRTIVATIKSNLGESSSQWQAQLSGLGRRKPATTLRQPLSPTPAGMTPLPRMDSRKWILPNDPTNGWTGPQNLSVESAVGYDDNYLYVFIDVRDDVHHQPRQPGMLWAGDSIQLGIDTRANGQVNNGYDSDDYEFGFGINDGKPLKELTHTADVARSKEILDAVQFDGWREGDITSYRIAIPWRELKMDGKAGTIFGMNFTANDNDGHKIRYWMGLTPGIVEAKNPGVYTKFITE